MRVFLMLGCAAALAGSPVHAQAPATPADAAATADAENPVDPRAIDALKRMSTYLQSLDSFRLTATTALDVVTVSDQKVQLDSVARYQVKKPGIMIDLASDQKCRQFFYDGKQFTMYAPQLKYYATVPAPATNREFLQALHQRTGVELPLEDLFRWASAEQQADIDKLTAAFNVGTATIDGAATDHWAFRSADFDWEVWIQQGDQPLPRKYVLIDRTDPTLPAYSARLAWEVNPTLDPAAFTFVPGPDAIAIQMSNPAEEVAQ
jgi:hypothetical protein